MKANGKNLQEEIRKLPLKEGGNQTGIAYITAHRFTTEKIHMPQTENPYLYTVLDGTLRLHTPSGIMDYMAGQYSVSKIDTPLSGTVLTFSEQRDFLALAVEFTPNDVITEVLELDNELTERIMGEKLKEENFRNSFTVEDLAEKRNMSVSLFHQKFKSAVGMGTLQCQKRLRLTEAGRLMLDENKNVTEASVEVGYESVSQFIRDYRKMFGSAPKEDILNIGQHLKK